MSESRHPNLSILDVPYVVGQRSGSNPPWLSPYPSRSRSFHCVGSLGKASAPSWMDQSELALEYPSPSKSKQPNLSLKDVPGLEGQESSSSSPATTGTEATADSGSAVQAEGQQPIAVAVETATGLKGEPATAAVAGTDVSATAEAQEGRVPEPKTPPTTAAKASPPSTPASLMAKLGPVQPEYPEQQQQQQQQQQQVGQEPGQLSGDGAGVALNTAAQEYRPQAEEHLKNQLQAEENLKNQLLLWQHIK